MRMQRRSAVTLFELLIVIAVIGLVGATFYAVTAPSKISALKSQSKANLSQIYKALLLYGSDNDVSDELPGMGPVPLVPFVSNTTVLLDYGLTRPQLHSPIVPPARKERWLSTYTWRAPIQQDRYLRETYDDLMREGSEWDCIWDLNFDRYHYWPQERDSDLAMLRRHVIKLHVNGSIKEVREPGLRANGQIR